MSNLGRLTPYVGLSYTYHMKQITIRQLNQFSGQWVAILDGRIIAAAENLPDLMTTLKQQTFKKEPAVMLVPRKNEGPYVLRV